MSINLCGTWVFNQKIRLVGEFKTKSFENFTYILTVSFKRAIPIKYFPTTLYDFETGT